jgi:hypothetical protein
MKEVMVMIPEQDLEFFLELMQKMGLNTYRRSAGEIPASQIAEIKRRDDVAEGQEFEDWENTKNDFVFQP